MGRVRLSAVLIAKDEERDLPGALDSVRGLADEVVVLLDASTRDASEAVARAAGALVSRRAFDGYGAQKQAALELASGDWVLSLDADERVTPELAAEIKRALAAGDGAPDGFEIPFAVRFMGKDLRWGGLGGERHLRLFRRAAGRFSSGAVHEGIELAGPVGRLSGRMRHEPYRDLSEYLAKLDAYTTLAARRRLEAGVRPRLWHHGLLPWEFFSRAVLRLGLLDGLPGLVWAGLSAFHRWLKYAKLAEMRRAEGDRR